MKTVCKKLLCLMLVAMLLVSAVPAAFAADGDANVLYVELKDEAGNKLGSTQKVDVTVGETYDAAAVAAFAEEKYPEYLDSDYEVVSAPSVTITDGTNGVVVIAKAVSADPCADGHAWNDGVMTTIDTCDAKGVKTFTCTECGETKTEEVNEIIGHMLANDQCMNRFSDGSRCTFVRETEPEEEKNEVTFTVYEVDANDNAKIVAEKTVDLNDYASEKELVKALYSGNYQKYMLRTERGTLHVWANPDKQEAFQLKVIHNDSTSDYTIIDIYEDEGILAAISNAGVVKKLKDQGKEVNDVEYRLVGFSLNHTGNSKTSLTIHHMAEQSLVGADGYIKVYADWEKKTDDDEDEYEIPDGVGGLYGDDNDDPVYDVVLYIYTNGKTSSYAKKVTASEMGKYTKDGKLTTGEVELVVNKYFKTYDDTKYYGLFTKYYWNDGNYLTKNAEPSLDLDPDETNYVYVMVKDAKAYVADSSNPKTGDTIMVAVTGMVLAAAGFVTMIELKKRKMI